MRIITISREFGSGGREMGRHLAKALDYDYYDREIITALSNETSLNEEFIEKTLDTGIFPTFTLTLVKLLLLWETLPLKELVQLSF